MALYRSEGPSNREASGREGGGTGRLGLSEAGPLPVPIDGRACSFPTPVSRLAPSLCSPLIAWPRGCPPPPPDPLSPLPMPRDAPLRASRGQTEVRYSNRFSASPLILQSSKLQVRKTEGILSHMPTSNNSSTINTLTTSVHIQSCCSLISSMDPPTHTGTWSKLSRLLVHMIKSGFILFMMDKLFRWEKV